MLEREKIVKEVWDNYWKSQCVIDKDIFKHYASYLTFRIIKREIGNFEAKKVLEIGGGSGKTSLIMALLGASVTIVDINESALDFSRRIAKQYGIEHKIKYVIDNALNLRRVDDDYDLVWSGGLLEHFESHEQKSILRKHIRVCRNGGKVIILVPHRKAFLYYITKIIAQRLKTWPYGPEEPLEREDFPEFNGTIKKVYSCGTLFQIASLSVIPKGWILSKIVDLVVNAFIQNKQRLLIDMKKVNWGYYLVAVYEKRQDYNEKNCSNS